MMKCFPVQLSRVFLSTILLGTFGPQKGVEGYEEYVIDEDYWSPLYQS